MISTVSELCDKALEYILTIPAKNKNAAYTPSGTLKKGNTLKTYNFGITCPDVNKSVSKTASVFIETGEDIPAAFLAAIIADEIKSDWDTYKNQYILTRLTSNTPVSISSLFLFLYLFRYFLDNKFTLFTDIYAKQSVWLYNTGTIAAPPQGMNIDIEQINMTNMSSYMSALVGQIIAGKNFKTLEAASSTNSCSSSSCSSSCSSSSSSSSSSCSSSSSSLFIAFFNIG